MAHIAIDARVKYGTGIGTYIVKLLEYLQQIDKFNHYTILSLPSEAKTWPVYAKNFEVKVADFANYSLAEQTSFKRFLDKLNPDLVHFTMPQQPIGYRGKSVTTFHDMTLLNTWNKDKNWLIFHAKQVVGRYVWKKIAKTNQHIIAISENTKKEYQEFSKVPDHKISVVYEAAEPVKGKPKKYQNLPFKDFIVYAGQQPDFKNIRRLMEAHQNLLTKYPKLGLVLIGKLDAAKIANQEWANEQGFRNIHFTDFLPDDERDWLYTKAQAYVFPSLMEGFGLPPLEAMSYGTTPVVSSNASCMPEILGEAAEYFDPFDVDDMTNAIERVITDPKHQKDLIEKGLEQVKKYSWETMAKEILEIYQAVLKQS